MKVHRKNIGKERQKTDIAGSKNFRYRYKESRLIQLSPLNVES
jgi:hypothetical protein